MRQRLLVAVATAVVLPGALSAQVSANIQATANVLAPLTVSGTQALDFGDVIPGVPSTLPPDDASAGSFTVGGYGTLEVTLDFGTLPSNLASGPNNLPISFGAGSAGYGDVGVSTTFDPSSVETTKLVAGALLVFIGGTVSPTPTQAAGAYSGTISLTVAYTGS